MVLGFQLKRDLEKPSEIQWKATTVERGEVEGVGLVYLNKEKTKERSNSLWLVTV